MDGSIIGLLVAGALREGPAGALPVDTGSPVRDAQASDFSGLLGLLADRADESAAPTALPFDTASQLSALTPVALAPPVLLSTEPLAPASLAADAGTGLPVPAWNGRTLALFARSVPMTRLASGSEPSIATVRTELGTGSEMAKDIAALLTGARDNPVMPPRQSPDSLVNLLPRLPTGESLNLSQELPDPIGIVSDARAGLSGARQSGVGYAAAAQFQLAPPLEHPGWNRALGQQLQWMVGQRLQEAEIKLNPPQLGPLEIKISMQHDQANVSFLSHHGQVREAVEQAIPRLREMLAEQGVGLGDVNVSEQSLAEQEHRSEQSAPWGRRAGGTGDEGAGDTLSEPVPRLIALGLLDVFA